MLHSQSLFTSVILLIIGPSLFEQFPQSQQHCVLVFIQLLVLTGLITKLVVLFFLIICFNFYRKEVAAIGMTLQRQIGHISLLETLTIAGQILTSAPRISYLTFASFHMLLAAVESCFSNTISPANIAQLLCFCLAMNCSLKLVKYSCFHCSVNWDKRFR